MRVAGSGQYQKLIEVTAKIKAEVELGERGNTQSRIVPVPVEIGVAGAIG